MAPGPARPGCSVVEIGSALRTARERLGFDLLEVERKTHIRGRYLAALEAERFELLPARAYAKGFLRVYAEFLGLDGRSLCEEFDARFPESEQLELAPPSVRLAPAHATARHLPVLLVVSLAVALLGVLAWRVMAPKHTAALPASPPPSAQSVRTVAAPRQPPRHASVRSAHLLLRARGPCWLSIRRDSAAGPALYEATLEAGQVLRYTLARARPQLWLRIGAPWNLELSLNGRSAAVPQGGPGNVLVTRRGIHST
jgi:transcriptional regulator with XRE-family HTH domain